MNKHWLVPLGIFAIIVVSGCLTNPLCKPDYISSTATMTSNDCKSLCFHSYQTTSFSFKANTTKPAYGAPEFLDKYMFGTCNCDVNKCGGQIIEP